MGATIGGEIGVEVDLGAAVVFGTCGGGSGTSADMSTTVSTLPAPLLESPKYSSSSSCFYDLSPILSIPALITLQPGLPPIPCSKPLTALVSLVMELCSEEIFRWLYLLLTAVATVGPKIARTFFLSASFSLGMRLVNISSIFSCILSTFSCSAVSTGAAAVPEGG